MRWRGYENVNKSVCFMKAHMVSILITEFGQMRIKTKKEYKSGRNPQKKYEIPEFLMEADKDF